MAQQLARHSDINLTIKTYTHLELRDLKSDVDRLPSFAAKRPASEAIQATGTDGRRCYRTVSASGLVLLLLVELGVDHVFT